MSARGAAPRSARGSPRRDRPARSGRRRTRRATRRASDRSPSRLLVVLRRSRRSRAAADAPGRGDTPRSANCGSSASARSNSAAALLQIRFALLALHRHEVHQAQRRPPREQQLLALLVQRERRLLDLAHVADAERDRRLPGPARSSLPCDRARSRPCTPWNSCRPLDRLGTTSGLLFDDLPDQRAVDVHVDVVHVGFDDGRAEHRGRLGAVRRRSRGRRPAASRARSRRARSAFATAGVRGHSAARSMRTYSISSSAVMRPSQGSLSA